LSGGYSRGAAENQSGDTGRRRIRRRTGVGRSSEGEAGEEEIGKCADAESYRGPASPLGVPRGRCSRWYPGCLGNLGLGVEVSLRDAGGGGRGIGVRNSPKVHREPPAVSAIARVTPRAGWCRKWEGVRSARVMPLAVAALGRRHAGGMCWFRFLSTLVLGKGREETSWRWGESTYWMPLTPEL
jgi:hypothetical protein